MEKELIQRLDEAIAFLKGQRVIKTTKNIAEKMDMNINTIYQAIRGNEKYLTHSFLKKFTHAFSLISFEWLSSGEGSMVIKENNFSSKNDITTINDKVEEHNTNFNSLPIEEKLNLLYTKLEKIEKENTEKIDTVSGALASLLLSVDEISDKMKKMDGE
ncbi:hypothetical protein [Tenacibaculum sp. nBUS_03]|uniref:hypothetical protein n=1 Tax=Tenacibaculum sp. nBUS_03 TaxID=3395320 RepID=UPI003EB7A394